MIAPGVPIDQINERHLESLIENEWAERRTVEYKRELPGGGDEVRKEFLADVSSFANANGGDLLFGIEARDGVPIKVSPLDISPDSTRLRWEQLIRDGVQPRLPGVRIQEIPVGGGHVLLIRVPKSWTGPHVVSFKNWSRFFSRTSAGKYQLDVTELRSAFLAGTTLGEQIRDFRTDRLGLIVAEEAPIPLAAGPKIVAHLVPYEAFTGQPELELTATEGSGLFRPLFQKSGGMGTRWNIDGLLTYDADTEEQRVLVYSQLFRNGIFEGVDAFTLRWNERQDTEDPYLYAEWFEDQVNTGLANPLEVLRRVGVQPPIAVLISVVGARDYVVRRDDRRSRHSWTRIDRDVVLLPDVIIEGYGIDYRDDLPRLLRPVVDAFWQAGGWVCSPYYDAEGNWKPSR